MYIALLIAINPHRKDLLEATENSHLTLLSIKELKEDAESSCGETPETPEFEDDIVAIIEWIDGTVLDSIWKVRNK